GYLNRPDVKEALHVVSSAIWQNADETGPVAKALAPDFTRASAPVIAKLLALEKQVTMYNGVRDGSMCNHIGNLKTLLNLTWAGSEEFSASENKPWPSAHSVMGHVRVARNLRFATVMRTGHLVGMVVPDAYAILLDMVLKPASELTDALVVCTSSIFLVWRGAPEKMHIIGAGLGRTATNSLKLALERLGHKTYHMTEALENRHQMIEWGRMARGEISHDDILDFVAAEGYTAGCDFPISLLYKDVMRRNPDAKDPAEKWAAGFAGDSETLAVPFESAVTGYTKWKEAVIAAVPKEKLLIFEAKDGWQPLCAFLEIEAHMCPSAEGEAYPYAPNDRAFMVNLNNVMYFLSDWFLVIYFLTLVSGPSLLILAVRCCCCRAASVKEKAA
ncbi:unnamed protein product, partial [Polarella glacialis]